MESSLKILFVSTEIFPYSTTGGLGDVSRSLPDTLSKKGHDVRIVTPCYKHIPEKVNFELESKLQISVRMHGEMKTGTLYEYHEDSEGSETLYFLGQQEYFDRDTMYNYEDDNERFSFFCKAVLEMLPRIDFQPDIIHCNDWMTAPVCMLLKEKYSILSFYKNIRSVFTIHNLAYQGLFSKESMNLLDLDDSYFHPESIEFYGKVNFMKMGLIYSDAVTTVSNTYAKEIQQQELGCGLEGVITKRKEDLFGIVNGVNYNVHDPANNFSLYHTYDIDSVELKQKNKEALLQELGLPRPERMVMSMITRIVEQKGTALIQEIIEELVRMNLILVIMGSGEEQYENFFTDIEKKYPDSIRYLQEYNPQFAQKIYAGSDVCLMPSRFEPCGLNQIISMKYGTIPIVRKTGGLVDTVVDVDENHNEGTGFSFGPYDSIELLKAIERAHHYYHQPELWKRIVKNAMNENFSWDKSASIYETVYRKYLSA